MGPLEIYNHLTTFVVHQKPRPGRRRGWRGAVIRTDQVAQVEAAIAARCEAQGASVAVFLAAAFAKHHWAYQPQFERLERPEYWRYFEGHRLEAAQWWRNVSPPGAGAVLAPHRELIKRRYRAEGKLTECMERRELTGGFCESSSICRDCEIQYACRTNAFRFGVSAQNY